MPCKRFCYQKLVHFEVFNAGGDENNRTKQTLVNNIIDNFPDAVVSYKENGVDPRNYRVSFEKVKSTLGFEPEYDIEYGIREIINGLKAGIFVDVDDNKNFYGNYKLFK